MVLNMINFTQGTVKIDECNFDNDINENIYNDQEELENPTNIKPELCKDETHIIVMNKVTNTIPFLPYAIIDTVNKKLQTCGNDSKKIISQLLPIFSTIFITSTASTASTTFTTSVIFTTSATSTTSTTFATSTTSTTFSITFINILNNIQLSTFFAFQILLKMSKLSNIHSSELNISDEQWPNVGKKLAECV
ncbi:15146_t:CDS:2 [Funneliformis caledonium]|uniref:15146_t:CDS:1 n=1 Tax=Funneliformis caledonium TaxID=1117310 RepID=A0A9N9FIH0_9GLOM|nr:15146_t:CDS:2 [Funneliformis caledonium]